MFKISDPSSSSSLLVYVLLAVFIALLSIGLFAYSNQDDHQTLLNMLKLLQEQKDSLIDKYLKK
jgi:hypothetical protein